MKIREWGGGGITTGKLSMQACQGLCLHSPHHFWTGHVHDLLRLLWVCDYVTANCTWRLLRLSSHAYNYNYNTWARIITRKRWIWAYIHSVADTSIQMSQMIMKLTPQARFTTCARATCEHTISFFVYNNNYVSMPGW